MPVEGGTTGPWTRWVIWLCTPTMGGGQVVAFHNITRTQGSWVTGWGGGSICKVTHTVKSPKGKHCSGITTNNVTPGQKRNAFQTHGDCRTGSVLRSRNNPRIYNGTQLNGELLSYTWHPYFFLFNDSTKKVFLFKKLTCTHSFSFWDHKTFKLHRPETQKWPDFSHNLTTNTQARSETTKHLHPYNERIFSVDM